MHAPRAQRTAAWLLALLLPLSPGCGHDERAHAHGSGGHAHVAPRGGVLVELGEHQGNLELLLDPANGELAVWSLDAHAESPVRLAAESLELELARIDGAGGARDVVMKVVLTPVASALTGETAGDTSEFRGQDPALVGAAGFAGHFARIEHRGAVYERVAVDYAHPSAGGR